MLVEHRPKGEDVALTKKQWIHLRFFTDVEDRMDSDVWVSTAVPLPVIGDFIPIYDDELVEEGCYSGFVTRRTFIYDQDGLTVEYILQPEPRAAY